MQTAYPWIRKLIADAKNTPVITDDQHVFLDEIDLNKITNLEPQVFSALSSTKKPSLYKGLSF